MRLALTFEYDGSDFVGFQSQNNGRAVQDVIENALSELYKTKIKTQGCSRTDAGVHARAHVCSMDVPFHIPEDKIPLALNPFLPDDVACKKAAYTVDDFNARFDSLGKRYIYRIYNSKLRSPLKDRYSYHCAHSLNVNAMREAASYFAGEHDFAAFCAAGGSQNTTVRRLYQVAVFEKGEDIEIVVQGEAFLYNMVRIIAGTLLEVGIGKLSAGDIPSIIASCDRKKAGRTLPPKGLTLEEVFYDRDKCLRKV